jgi:hypothetical protein
MVHVNVCQATGFLAQIVLQAVREIVQVKGLVMQEEFAHAIEGLQVMTVL